MLRITEAKKLHQKPLGFPAGKEIRVKQAEGDFTTGPVYVKFGRELSKHPGPSDGKLAWNVTMFDTALNHPQQPWTVTIGNGKPMVLAVRSEGLGVFEENSSVDKKVDGGDELAGEEFGGRNSTIDLVVQQGKDFVVALDDTRMVHSFEVRNSKGRFSLETPTLVPAEKGGILPITKQDGSTLLVAINSGEQSALHKLDGRVIQPKKTPLKAAADAIKILMTNSGEVLHISAQGLNVYAVSDSSTSLKYYCPFFSGLGGWSRQFIDSVQLMKIENGQETLIGTGPKGIEYFKLTNECRSFIVEGSGAGADLGKMKHALVTSATGKVNNKFKVLGYYNGELHVITLQLDESARVIPEWKEPQGRKEIQEKVKATANAKFSIQPANKSRKVTRWLRDSIDEACFKNIVDKIMGKVKFSFPLIDLQDRMGLPIKLMVYYEESESEEVGVLGRHWTLGKDCIVMDHRNTVFEEEHEYYLIKDQMKIRLVRDWSKQRGENSIWFYVKGISGVNFEYNRSEEKWVVSNGKVRYTYGVKNQGVVTVTGWDNWNGPSEKLDGKKQLSVEWNLVEIRSTLSEDVKISYQYGKIDPSTNSMHLQNIIDNDNTKITFTYKSIDTKTTKLESGTVKEHTFINNKLLKGIQIDTPSFTQNLQISTTSINNLHYLESIKQDGDQDPVLKFAYNTVNELMPKIAQIDLPSKSILKIDYSQQAIDTSKFHQEEDKYSDLYSGMEYSLLIRKNPDETTITISTKDSSGRNDFVGKEKMSIAAVTGHRVKSFIPFIKPNYFALVVDYSKGEETVSRIYIFNRGDDKKFKQDNSRPRNADSKLPRYDFQDDFFTYYNSGKIHFEYRNNPTSTWTIASQDIGKVILLTMISRGAVYFTDKLSLIRCDQTGKFVQKRLSDSANPPKLSDIDTLFTHIDVQGTNPQAKDEAAKEVQKYIEEVKTTFNNHGLVVYNNLVALRTVLLTPDGKISIKAFLYLLNPSYEPSQTSTLNLEGEDINKFVLKLDVHDKKKAKSLDDLHKYRFEFKKSGAKYQLKFIEATDKSGKKTDPSAEYKNNMEAYERQLKIPLDFEKYMMQVNHDGIILGNQRIFHSEGKFAAKPMDRESLKLTKFRFPMGSFSSFKKDSKEDVIKFCTQKEQQRAENCVSLDTDTAHNVSVKYPYFFVVQKRTAIKVLPLKLNGRGWEDPVEYQGETARASTSHAVMVTTQVANNKTIIRPTKSLNKENKAVVQVVQLEQLSTPYEDYKIRYEFGEPSVAGNEFAFKNTTVIPGDDKRTFGYFRESNDLKSNQQVVQVITADDEVFDPEYVKRMNEMQEEEQKQREPAKVNAEQAIMDKTGNRVILKTTPYMRQQNLVHFIGFEDYEDMREWSMVSGKPLSSAIHRSEFSATGRNFLLLRRGETLIREIKNISYFDYFIASAWVRTTREVTVGSHTDMITIYVNNRPMQGEIKQSIDDWIYVEATTKGIEVTNSTTATKVTLKTVLQASIDDLRVDHVRISPMNFNLEANVYDSKVGQRTAQIHNNGRISRRMFDSLGRRIGEVDENGNVKFLTSYSKRIRNEKATSKSKLEGSNIARIQIKPKLGWVEDCSPYTIDKRWSFAGSSGSLTVEPRTIILQGTMTYKYKFSGDSICVRFVYNIKGNSMSVLIGKTSVVINRTGVSYKQFAKAPTSAEIIIFTTPKFTTIWIDGHIAIEAAESKSPFTAETLAIQTSGLIEISDLVVMEDAEAHISYMNRDYKPLQEILLQNSSNVLIRQMTYDALGRKEAETVWTRKPINGEQPFKVFQYQEDFVENDDPAKSNHFLKQGPMTGVVSSANPMFNNFPYSQIVYHRNPLEIRHIIGQPGRDYSVKGKHFHEYNIESGLPFIQMYYPRKDGYRQEQEKKPNGIVQVTVYNRRNKKVAEYVQVKDYKNLLTTYEYDQHGNQVQMVPPNYYDEQRKKQPRVQGFKPEKSMITSPWVVSSEYDKTGELITKKTTPDGGQVDFLYNEFNQLRYQLHYGENKQVDLIVYFLYNVFGRVCEAGQLPASAEMVRKVQESTKTHQAIPSRDYVMYFDYGEADSDPALRGRVQRTVKKNRALMLSEVLHFDEDGNVIRKSYTSPVTNVTLSLEYLKENEQVGGIRYPFVVDGEELVLKIRHNLKGDIVEISRTHQKGGQKIEYLPIASMDHDAEGRLTKISHLYGEMKFDQRYKYIPPGYLESIENEFLSEKVYYTEKGYGCGPTGDGSILRTEFTANWHEKCDQNLIPLTARAFVSGGIDFKLAEACFDALFNLGYIDTKGRPTKTFYPDMETRIPARCSTTPNWRHISEMLLAKGFPEQYGHAYDYGSHGELVAAKSFIGNEKDKLNGPLTKESFSTAGFTSTKDMERFWDGLKGIDYKLGGTKVLFEDVSLKNLITQVIHKLKLEAILTEKENQIDNSSCPSMAKGEADERKAKSECDKTIQNIWNQVRLKEPVRSLNPSVKAKVLNILKTSLATSLGSSPGDVESFSIDPNGNHGVFYTGFKRFELQYKQHKNQIKTIKEGFNHQPREIAHDSQGNVIKALHKNIEKIEYDPLTQRVSRIELAGKSRVLEFGYDFRGERTIKRVRNANGELISETYYVRDNKGNTLVEYKQVYPNPKESSKSINTITAYIHGPLGLIGFFRNNKYYNVLLDHEGSTRLVVHNGEVVAAYDYLPYGQLMRTYGSNPEAHIAYRYTGQELDEETSLYNYHARIYDPDIGRFYQMDPLEQYPSPYKYAGNSPVTQIDPDGQFAFIFLFMAIAALIGAYVGASAANNSWNPAKWDWTDKKTWFGMFVGAVSGAFAVYGGVAAVGIFAGLFGGSMVAGVAVTGVIAVAGAYLGAAGATNQWNPAKWDWTSPAIWNGIFNGVAVAVSLPTGVVGIVRSFYSITTTAAKIVYTIAMASGFLLFAYIGGSLANRDWTLQNWDWKSPQTWFGVIEGAATILIAVGGIVKHGAAKTHYIVSPDKMKVAWYRINIPKKSFGVVRVQDDIVLSWYKQGQLVGREILKTTSKAAMARIPTHTTMMTRSFFMPWERIGYYAIAAPLFAGVKFQTYKTFFNNYPNSTEEKSTRRKRSADNSRSSASSSASSLFGEFTKLFSSFYAHQAIPLDDFPKSSHDATVYTPPLSPKVTDKSFEKLCYSPNGLGNQIICPQRESTVSVFAKLPEFDPDRFGEDSFRNCQPVHWFDRPSVTCDGQESTFIYTPVQNGRLFDMVDGWLLLARVAPAAVRNLKAGFDYVKNVFAGDPERTTRQIRQLSNVKSDLEKQLSEVDKILRTKTATEVDWARSILADLKDDVGEFVRKENPSRKELVMLQERLDSLIEDLLEDDCFAQTLNFGSTFLDKAKEMFTHETLAQHGGLVGCQTSDLSAQFSGFVDKFYA